MYFQSSHDPPIYLPLIDLRLKQIDSADSTKKATKAKQSVYNVFTEFLAGLPHRPTIASTTPMDVRRFLVWKDQMGKTKVHHVSCPQMAKRKGEDCDCPTRLASGTVETLVRNLAFIFESNGRGRSWNIFTNMGNPALSNEVKAYILNMLKKSRRRPML